MSALLRMLCCFLMVSAAFGRGTNNEQSTAPAKVPMLEDGTPVHLRISQSVSSADARVSDRVEFEVLDDIKIADVVIVPKGGIAWGTVTAAHRKRRLGRGGKLEIVLDEVRLADGERVPLRATKEAQGGGHVAVMTVGIVGAGLLFFPVAPLFLLIQGKDITIAKGTRFRVSSRATSN